MKVLENKINKKKFYIVDVIGKENIFEVDEYKNKKKSTQILKRIESSREIELQAVARMHASKLLLTNSGVGLVNGSQNLHEAVRIYSYLENATNKTIAQNAKKELENINNKYSEILKDRFYYLKVGKNFVYASNNKIYEICINNYEKYSQLKKTLQGVEKGLKKSQYNMGVWLEKNNNIADSMKYYEMSAEQGFLNAQYNLGILLKAKGNIEGAKIWFEKAANQGDTEAKQHLDELISKNDDIIENQESEREL
jgi:TPR repeat protein